MNNSPTSFLKALAELKITHLDRAIALLWWYDLSSEGCFKHPQQLAEDLEAAGYAKQNLTRLARELCKSKLTRKGPKGSLGIKVSSRTVLTESYRKFVNHIPVVETDSVLPRELFDNTRGYIVKVVHQINASYDCGLFDCCSVMCRRLLETLIIETYEAKGRDSELKNSDGNFKMYAGLLNHIENEKGFNLGRNVVNGLKDFKVLGDRSAHDRRFNARKSDIDRIQGGLRVASEALLHEARLILNR